MSNQFPKTSSINRKNAIDCGQKIYDGVPCKTCGSTKKHVSSYSCVNCNVKRNLPKLYDKELMSKYRTKDKVDLYWKNNPDKFKAKNMYLKLILIYLSNKLANKLGYKLQDH